MKQYFSNHWISLLIPLPFLLLKLTSTSTRLSDTNVYFYTAYQILQGKLLYADIFFTNFPVFPYLSALYLALTGNNVYFYYFSAAIEVAVTSLFIYLIIFSQWKSRVYAATAQSLYLFSFIILATTDHQSGVFAAGLFAVVSYFFFQKKRFVLTGIFAALAVLTKAYFLPLILTYGFYLLIIDRRNLIRYISGGLFAATVVLIPFFLFASSELISNVFAYSLTRGAGTSKLEVMQFFIFRDTMFFMILITNLLLFRRYLFFSIFSLFALIFIFLYKDIYYLYLNNLASFLVLSFPIYQDFIAKKMVLQRMVIPSFVIFYLAFNAIIYFSQYRNLQTVEGYDTLVKNIMEQKPAFLYGTNDLTPILAYDTSTPLLNSTVDTNANIFRKGLLDARKLTKDAIDQRAIVVVHGAVYPHFNVNDPILDEVVVKKDILEKCELLQSQPVYAEGVTNRINLFKCFK